MAQKKELMENRDSLMSACHLLTAEISTMRENMKYIENTKLNQESDVKSLKKTLNETDERIKKDEERNQKHQKEIEKLQLEKENITKEKEMEQSDIREINKKLGLNQGGIDENLLYNFLKIILKI